MSKKAAKFMSDWVSKNVHNDPLVDGDNYDRHIAGLKAKLEEAAFKERIELEKLEGTVGDLDDYLVEAFERVYDPTVGGIKD
jgi:hypothetical protein